MKILSLDASVGACSAAVWNDGAVLARRLEPEQAKQASRLVPMLEEVLHEAGLRYPDMDLVATTIGPGSFTGIRIGLSTARAICLAAQLPLVGVSTLETLAHASGVEGPVLSVLLAGKGQVYAQLFAGGEAMTDPQALEVDEAVSLMPAGCVLVGNASLLLADALRAAGQKPKWLENVTIPDAVSVASLASRKEAVPFDRVAPLYVRPPDAKLPSGG